MKQNIEEKGNLCIIFTKLILQGIPNKMGIHKLKY